MSKNIGDGIINADTLSLYARLESLGIPSPLMVRAVTEPISLLRLRKCSDLHYAITSGRELLMHTYINSGEHQATINASGVISFYDIAGKTLTDKQVWYLHESYQGLTSPDPDFDSEPVSSDWEY